MESSSGSSSTPLPLVPSQPTPGAVATAAARWKAVTARDASNNTFVYAVHSTRIYCRPSCPARLARRANVEFFDTPAQAESAGYRACKRCQFDVDVKGDRQSRLVQQALNTITAAVLSSSSGGRGPRLQELAAEANLTPSHFHRVFKRIAGVTPRKYARALRDTIWAEKDDFADTTKESDASFLQHVDGFNQRVDLCQAQPDATIISGDDFTMDDLIDWDHFDDMMRNVEKSDALGLGLGT